jgi:hypothetical protein
MKPEDFFNEKHFSAVSVTDLANVVREQHGLQQMTLEELRADLICGIDRLVKSGKAVWLDDEHYLLLG